MSLVNVQQDFQDFLLYGKLAITAQVRGDENVSVTQRLGIYKNAYSARLEEALAHNFPLMNIYLGGDQFGELTSAYCACHPSIHRSIRWFGDQLENFLTHDSHYGNFPYLAEMARFEWAMTLVFDAADSPIVQIPDIACIAPENWQDMRLSPHPSLQRRDFTWNVPDICQSLLQEQEPDELVETKPSIPWLLWRKDFTNFFTALNANEAWALDALINGATFGEIGEGLCQWFDEDQAGMHAASLLKGWLEQHLITKVNI